MNPAPIFARDADGAWLPSDLARGPFGGVQGGAAAALMCAAIEDAAPGFVASVTTHFLKPAPMAPLTVTITPLRQGRRAAVFDARLEASDSLVAVQRATVIAPIDAPSLPTPPAEPAAPAAHPIRRAVEGRALVSPYLMDAMETRRGPDGLFWFRPTAPIVESGGPMTRVLPVADWAHGLPAPMGAHEPGRVMIPNTDLTVNLFRPPVGEWIGLEPATAWSRQSIGAGWAALSDVQGLIGRVAMSIAISLPAATPSPA